MEINLQKHSRLIRSVAICLLIFTAAFRTLSSTASREPNIVETLNHLQYAEFIQSVRVKSGLEPLERKRIRELIGDIEKAVEKTNEYISCTPWDRGQRITVREIMECIATEVSFQNIICQAPWEKEPNFGYTQLQAGTALNALWDLKIKTLHNMPVPVSNRKFRRDKRFRQYLEAILMRDPDINIYLGAWTYLKLKNLSRGIFEHTVGSYTMGRASYQKRGLSPVAIEHLVRWRKWSREWSGISDRLVKAVKRGRLVV